MRKVGRNLKRRYFQFLRLLFYSSDSKHKIALGGAVGLFWGLTPTVGMQMAVLTLTFSTVFFLNKLSSNRCKVLEFNLPIAIAVTWVSNPLDAAFLYFGWYAIGEVLIGSGNIMNFDDFMTFIKPLFEMGDIFASLTKLGEYFNNLWAVLLDLKDKILYPLIVGSLVTAIPLAPAFYFFLRWFLTNSKFAKSRRKK
jgi:uncharacterized protein